MAKGKMRPAKRQTSKQQPKAKPRQVARVSPPSRGVFDRAALEWAMLLRDPCNAKLTYPCYPGGTGGTVLIRLEADSIIANGATETAAFGAFIPGIGASLANATPQTSDTAPGSLLQANANIQPGATFISANANALKCVAACVQLSYPGSELNRAGIVGIGVVPATTTVNALATASGGGNINSSAQAARIACQHVERMPAGVVECKWFPGEADASEISMLNYPTSYGSLFNGRNAILWTASGFPVSTGVRVRCVAVYEVSLQSTTASGQVQAVAPPVSSNTPAQILRAMAHKDPQWYIESATKAGRAIGTAISYAAQGAKAAGAFVNGVALMMA